MLVLLLVDASEPVEAPFYRPQYRREPGPLAGEDAVMKPPNGFASATTIAQNSAI